MVAQIVDPTIFTTRNRVVYANPVTVYQGIDNPMQVVVKNQDQKSVNFTGLAMQADIQDPVNMCVVASYSVVWADITKGQGTFTIDKDTINGLEQRFYKLTFKSINLSDNTEAPIYTDDNYAVPVDLKVLPAYYDAQITPFSNTTIIDGGTI